MKTIMINISGPTMMVLSTFVVVLFSALILSFFNTRLRKEVEKRRQENIELMQSMLVKECVKVSKSDPGAEIIGKIRTSNDEKLHSMYCDNKES
ncbi:MAG: hypothetical protein P9L97_06135 [Candidatus Tenebribacter davisii]|nr:hypothetical protein [Candidatus Tenebribacter davisii]